MKPSELSAKIVREELQHLIDTYPFNTGLVNNISCNVDDVGYEDPTCVYFTDDKGQLVTPIGSGVEFDPANVMLATPVCIVGMWIEEFHPSFKEDEVIRDVLVRNATIKSLDYTNVRPWDEDVQRLLVNAQNTQDRGVGPWSSIDLDVNPNDL